MSGHRTPDAPGLWKAAHGGYGVMFHDDGEPAMLILSSIRQAKQDRYRSRSFPMRHHYALRAQKT